MFRRKEDSITPDASYPSNLKELGFFVNQLGHIRMIEAPEKPFVFHSLNNERHNEVRNEALHMCVRAEVTDRLRKLGINQLYLPQLTTTKPDGPHIPILAPSLDILKNRQRIVVVINDASQDVGILAYRQLQRELGVNGGSVINFVKEMTNRSAAAKDGGKSQRGSDIFRDGACVDDDCEIPGLIVMNTGQLLYSHKYNRPMTMKSWFALPRKSIAHDHIRIHDEENYVEGHRNPTEHIKSVFDQLLCDSDRVAPDAEVYVVAIEGGADKVLEVFKEDFPKYGSRVTAMAVVHSLVDNSEITDPTLKAFIHQRTRQWKYTDLCSTPAQCTELPNDYSSEAQSQNTVQKAKPVSWSEERPSGILSEITKTLHRLALSFKPKATAFDLTPNTTSEWMSSSVLCPTFAGGNESAGESVFTDSAVQDAILSFFEEVAKDPENYCNPAFTIFADVRRPTADAPFALSADPTVPESSDIQPASAIVTPEQEELDEAREKLAEMRLALEACPEDVNELARGRVKLIQKIANHEMEIKDLEMKALSSGSLRAGEAEELRQDWSPKADGPQVPFAGTMVDSELLKAAGLCETANEELEKLEKGEEKAFL